MVSISMVENGRYRIGMETQPPDADHLCDWNMENIREGYDVEAPSLLKPVSQEKIDSVLDRAVELEDVIVLRRKWRRSS